MLNEIWNLQWQLNQIIGIDTIKDKNKLDWLFSFAYQIQDELYELNESINKRDINNAKIELIDILHFLVSIWQLLDINIADLKINKNNETYLDINEIKYKIQSAMFITHQLQKCCLTKWWVTEYKENPNKLFKQVLFIDKAKQLTIELTNIIFSMFKYPFITWDEILNIYKAKHKKNIERQKNNYSIKNKTEDDNQEIIKDLNKND